MRVFTCLSRNVSMALDTTQRLSDERRPKNRLNFKTKKRRTNASEPASAGGTPKRPAPAGVLVSKQPSTAVKNTTGKSIRFQDENTPPPFSSNYSTGSMNNSKKSRVPPTLPLPPIPDDDETSVYIKELNDSLNDDDSDYLPLCHVEPVLTEEETTASSSPSLLLSSRHYSSTTAATTTSSDYTLSSPASRDGNVYQKISNAKTESTTTFSNVKSVGSFNDAFIQSAVSLPRMRNVLSSTRLDDCISSTTRHPRGNPKSPKQQNTSSMTSDPKYMTYSRRRVQNAQKKRQRMEIDYYNHDVSRGSNSSASVEEVSDLLEASVAEYNNVSGRRRGGKRCSRRSAVTDTVEVFASSCDNTDYGSALNEYSSLGVQTQTINVDDTTQQSQDFVYSRLVDYTSSALPSEAETEEEQESRYYENEVRPAMLCEGQSQTSLVRSRGTSAPHAIANSTCDTDSMASRKDNSQADAYDDCASQSSCFSYGDETEYTADSFHSYVNVDVVEQSVTADEISYVNIERSRRDDDGDVDDTIHVDDTCSGSRASEFLGCMSFGVPHLLKKDLDGWYYLLTEEVGRKKHLQARGVKKPVLTSRGQPNVPIPNLMVEGQEKIVISVPRGKNGFGFSFIDELPPKIGRVDRASPAEQAGVKKGDIVVSINGKNVSRSTSKGVAHLVKQLKAKSLTLELQRDHIIPTATAHSGSSTTHNLPPPTTKRSVGTSNNDDHLYESIMERSARRDHYKENRRAHWLEEETAQTEEDLVSDDSQNYTRYKQYGGSVPNLKAFTSTPMPHAALYHKQTSAPMARQESIHRLMSLELDFIDFMHYGIERYSRPLRHCIISAQQHGVMFQNVEKLVTISEYHIKQMQENAASSVNSEDTDDSQSSESSNMFPNSVALIYQSKIHMLCQAYESYAHGLLNSNTLLRELRANRDFLHFIKETSADGGSMFGHPTISGFINRPVQHINELYTVFSEIFSMTPHHSPDYPVLQKITCKLAQCITAITSLSSVGRVHSLDSLTSSQGCSTSQTTSSGKGSMASLTSCSSAEMDALRTMKPPSSSLARPVDAEVARIQDRLVFPPHIPTFQLCQDDRHIIFQGDMYRCQQGTWFKSHLLLLSDLLLILDQEPNGRLRVVDTPIYLSDVSGIEVNRKHASEFILHLHTTAGFSSLPRPASQAKHQAPNTRLLVLRAHSAQEKFMWKSLLEQRVSSVSGVRLQHYGSMRDISNVKTSLVL